MDLVPWRYIIITLCIIKHIFRALKPFSLRRFYKLLTTYILYSIRGMIQKFWSWCDTSVTSNVTCLKISPNTNTFFVYTSLWQIMCNSKERPEICPETAIPYMHWPIKHTVHIWDLTIQTRAVSAIWFHGCSMFIRKPLCPVKMANFLYDLGFLGPCMYGYATVSYNQILDHLKFWPAHSVVTTAVIKVKIVLGKRWTDFCLKQLKLVGIVGDW